MGTLAERVYYWPPVFFSKWFLPAILSGSSAQLLAEMLDGQWPVAGGITGVMIWFASLISSRIPSLRFAPQPVPRNRPVAGDPNASDRRTEAEFSFPNRPRWIRPIAITVGSKEPYSLLRFWTVGRPEGAFHQGDPVSRLIDAASEVRVRLYGWLLRRLIMVGLLGLLVGLVNPSEIAAVVAVALFLLALELAILVVRWGALSVWIRTGETEVIAIRVFGFSRAITEPKTIEPGCKVESERDPSWVDWIPGLNLHRLQSSVLVCHGQKMVLSGWDSGRGGSGRCQLSSAYR